MTIVLHACSMLHIPHEILTYLYPDLQLLISFVMVVISRQSLRQGKEGQEQ